MTSRRQFIRLTGGLMTIAVGGLQIACSREETAHIESAGLKDVEVLSLVRVQQHILPHQGLANQVYLDAVVSLTSRTAEDGQFRQMIEDGIDGLNQQQEKWLEASEEKQLVALRGIDKSEFFKTMQTNALEQLYRDERTWGLVGYEGEAIKFGGYLNRGFNDIDWLPAVPEPVDVDGGTH